MLSSQNLEIAIGGISQVSVPGTYFKYQAGTVSAGTDFTIGVKFGNQGDEVDLVPGQAIRLSGKPDTWRIRNKGSGNVTLKLIIGDGEFLDSAVSFSGGITVGNEVEVKNDSGSPLTVQDTILTSNKFFFSDAVFQLPNNGYTIEIDELVTPASNVNGLLVQDFELIGNGTYNKTLYLAFGTLVNSPIAGYTILKAIQALSAGQKYNLNKPIKIPSGKGLYLLSTTVGAPSIAGVLRTMFAVV